MRSMYKQKQIYIGKRINGDVLLETVQCSLTLLTNLHRL